MKLAKELVITTLFLVLYFPLSITIWYVQGRTASFLIISAIGLAIIDSYLAVQVIRSEFSRRRLRFQRTHIRAASRPEIEEETFSTNPDPFLSFRQLFSQDSNHGGGAL